MAKLSDLPKIAQIGVVLALVAGSTIALYMLVFKPIDDQNQKDLINLKGKQAEVAQLAPYRNKLSDLENQIASLKQQIDLQRRIVPDSKEVPSFIDIMQGEAVKAGVELRRFTAKPVVAHEYYSEVPFDIDVDGPYYAVLNFFQRVSQLERIINISNMQMASVHVAGQAHVKKLYTYAPGESVVANCTATTFYSNTGAAPAKPVKR